MATDEKKKDKKIADETVTGSLVKKTADDVVNQFIVDLISKSLVATKEPDKTVDSDEKKTDNKNDDESKFVTQDMLKSFGEGLIKNLESMLKSTDVKKSNSDDETKTVTKESGEETEKSKLQKMIKDTVQEVLSGGKASRKSYVIVDGNKLVKNVEGELPKGASEIDVNTISMDEWDALDPNVRNQILNQEFSNILHRK